MIPPSLLLYDSTSSNGTSTSMLEFIGLARGWPVTEKILYGSTSNIHYWLMGTQFQVYSSLTPGSANFIY